MSRVVVTGGTGIVLVGFGLWCAMRPVDMGSYEPNCLPPIFEGTSDERCSDLPRSAGGLVLLGAGALALVVARATCRQVD